MISILGKFRKLAVSSAGELPGRLPYLEALKAVGWSRGCWRGGDGGDDGCERSSMHRNLWPQKVETAGAAAGSTG